MSALARLLLFTAALAAFAFAQEPAGEKDRHDDPMARAQWLYEQRAYPRDRIPPRARERALEHRQAMEREEARRIRINAIASPEAPLASAAQWTFIGPRPINSGSSQNSGRVPALAVHPTNPDIAYAGGAQGGVWKTTDAGATWVPLTDSQPTLAIGAIAIAPSDPNIIYAGTGEQSFSGDSYYGQGVLKSTDGGATWTLLGQSTFKGPFGFTFTLGGMKIGGIAVHPTNPNLVFAAANRFEQSNSGLYRSTDGGQNWTLVLDGPPGNAVYFDPGDAGRIFVGMGSIFGPSAAANSSGVYRCTDLTATPLNCSKLTTGLPSTNVGRVELALSKPTGAATVIYAAIQNSPGPSVGTTLLGVFKSTDGGDTWSQLSVTDFCTPQCWYDLVISVHPTNPALVFAGGSATSNFMTRSTTGGATWTSQTAGLHVDQHAMAWAADGSRLYIGNDGGVWRTDAPSATSVSWTNLNATLELTQFYPGISIHPTDANITLGGTQDNGSMRYSGDFPWLFLDCGDGAYTAIDHQNPNNVYIGCQRVDLNKSTNQGLPQNGFPTFTSVNNGIPTDPNVERVQFIPPLVMDPSDSQRLYFGTYRLWQTTNGAGSWTAISPNLTNIPETQSGSTAIKSIAVAPSNPAVVYTGSSDGQLYRSTNALSGSPTWTQINTSTSRTVTAIAVDPANADIAVATFSGFATGSASGPTSTPPPYAHVFRTTNGGQSWADISGNLPDTPVNDVVIDPDLPGTIYVGTDVGVFRTQDNGVSWHTMVSGLPNVAVFSLKLHLPSRILRAATHGRGMWDVAVPVPITITATPDEFAIGNVLTGTAKSSSMQLRAGGGALNITGISASAPFTATHDCPASLARNATCNISVTFAAAASGAAAGTLTVTSNAASSPSTYPISATGFDFAVNLLRQRRPVRPTAVAIPAGETAQVEVALSSAAPLHEAATLACTTSSPLIACSVPASLALNGSNASFVVNVETQKRALTSRRRVGRRSGTGAGSYQITVTATVSGASRQLSFPISVR